MLAACLLTDEPVRLSNVPLIDDVRTMLSILDDLGVQVDIHGHTVTLTAKGIRKRRLNAALCGKVRSSILLAGPMAAKFGKITLFPPGGDLIGRRPIDTHLSALRALGISMQGKDHYMFVRRQLKGADILLDEASVTATENTVMAAVLAPGRTTIFNAACEPHVQELCHLLNKMGAHISNIGTNFLKIRGVEQLHGVSHRIEPDYIDTVSFMAAAAVTGGSLTIRNVPDCALSILDRSLKRMGLRWDVDDRVLTLQAEHKLRIQNAFGSAIPKMEDGVWPGFPSDLMSVAIVMATQSKGTMLFFEKMFESRMYFVDRLIEMGARIVQCDPHRVLVSGPSRLHGSHLSSPDIRAGMALLIAALCARGKSIIDNAQVIDRGYERIDLRLKALGADIERIERPR